jgi:hypothetical protein
MRKLLLITGFLLSAALMSAQPTLLQTKTDPTTWRSILNGNTTWFNNNKADKTNPTFKGVMKWSDGTTVTDSIPLMSQVRTYVSTHGGTGGSTDMNQVQNAIKDSLNTLRSEAESIDDLEYFTLPSSTEPTSSGNTYLSIADNRMWIKAANNKWYRLAVDDSTTASAPTSSLLTGLQAYYKFNESSGNIIDYSGNGKTGVPTNLTYGQTGKISTAGSFNGTSSVVTVSNFPQGTSGLTISFWLKTSSTAEGTLVQCYNTGTNVAGYWIQYYSGYFTIMLGNGTTTSNEIGITGSYNDNAWHNFIFTYDGTNLLAYVDNVNKLTTTFSGGINYTGVTDLSFMATDYGTGFVGGLLDEVGFWNRTITSTERATLNVPTAHPF